MKNIIDGVLILVIAAIVAAVVAVITAIIANSALPPENVRQLAGLAAAVTAMAIIFFWVLGRYASIKIDRLLRDYRQIAGDFGEYFANLDDKNQIYDDATLPHAKEDILSALLWLAANDPISDYGQFCGAIAPELSLFQPGVGKKSIVTFAGIIASSRPESTPDLKDMDFSVKEISSHEETEFEKTAKQERNEIFARVALARESSG